MGHPSSLLAPVTSAARAARSRFLVVEPTSAQGTGPSEAGPGCTKEKRFAGIEDERIFCPAGINEIVVDGGAGDDTMVFDLPAATPYDVRADAGSGDDDVRDFAGGATIQLGDGDDTASASKTKPTTVFGGAGNDDLLCGDSSGAGRAKARRVLDGGAGKDRLCGGLKDDRLSGGAGDDKVYAGEGDDVLDGGASDDLLEGGDDADRITGGAGEDEIDGGSGKDLIRAKDREQDEVDGGSKRDTVHADRADDLTRCEIIRRA